ncbi:Heat shock protein HSP20/alpha crystallin family, putative isoform 1 [Theobroma cacao]|uniref:Heat shock protein HSP20/alpha crystallin family, putative isoform 1 n=1 Tax=Theobroma cacao TaxID=3641 RepID=A0A061G454_THECC|nr:Heat shock protein HSP20/alpha crystallin family, putative isoform 1 [Theobroma cacao]
MAAPEVILCYTPHTEEGYYAKNNQFQNSGPKGFIEFKVLENQDLYVRVDLPGVASNGVSCFTDPQKKVVFFSGEAPKDSEHEQGSRTYFGITGLICNCCEISRVNATMKDGVLRMVLSKVKKTQGDAACSAERSSVPSTILQEAASRSAAGPQGGTGPVIELNPFVVRGHRGAFEGKASKKGGLFARVDMPGVSPEDANAFFKDGEIRFIGTGYKVSEHDESGRTYLGSIVPVLPTKRIMPSKLDYTMKDGVLRIIIPPI